MIKIENNSNKLIISHIADIDGMGSVILSKLIFKKIDVILIDNKELTDVLNDLIKDKSYIKYDNIFIIDISIIKNNAEIIENENELKTRIKHFDHHTSDEILEKDFDFINVKFKIKNKKTCGTELFYNYIKGKSKILNSNYVKDFVEAIRNYDTYDWIKNKNLNGKHLTNIFSFIGPLKFIDRYFKEIKNNYLTKFKIDKFSLDISKNIEENIHNYIKKCEENMIKLKFFEYNVGCIISELYRSDVGNTLSKMYKNELDFIIICDFIRNNYSLRTANENINLGIIVKKFSNKGGGQGGAAGIPIDKSTYWILEEILKEKIKR